MAGEHGAHIGLAISRDETSDHFVSGLAAALASTLVPGGYGLLTKIVDDIDDELDTYLGWARQPTIAAVVLLGVGLADRRVQLLSELGLTFAAITEASVVGDFPAVHVDAAAGMALLDEIRRAGGYQHSVYFAGSQPQVGALTRGAVDDRGLTVIPVVPDMATALKAARASTGRGRALYILDSGVHAASCVSLLAADGVAVPGEVAVVSFTDSAVCQRSKPAITAINRRGVEIGAQLGEVLRARLAEQTVLRLDAPAPVVVYRQTT